jgi:hypothetical protein
MGSDEIARKVLAAPDAPHLVWKAGFDAWKPAKDVPEIAARLVAPPPPPGAPPPPPMMPPPPSGPFGTNGR